MKPDWNGVLTIALGTLPVLGAILWNLLKLDRLETRMDRGFEEIRTDLREIRLELARYGERLATLEERDRLSHPVIQG